MIGNVVFIELIRYLKQCGSVNVDFMCLAPPSDVGELSSQFLTCFNLPGIKPGKMNEPWFLFSVFLGQVILFTTMVWRTNDTNNCNYVYREYFPLFFNFPPKFHKIDFQTKAKHSIDFRNWPLQTDSTNIAITYSSAIPFATFHKQPISKACYSNLHTFDFHRAGFFV